MRNPPAAKGDRKNEIKHDYTDGICLITAQTWWMCDLCGQAKQTSVPLKPFLAHQPLPPRDPCICNRAQPLVKIIRTQRREGGKCVLKALNREPTLLQDTVMVVNWIFSHYTNSALTPESLKLGL